jgi:hypothetical protein
MALHAPFEQLFGDPEHFFSVVVVSCAAKGFELCMKCNVHGFELRNAAGIFADRNRARVNAGLCFFHGPVQRFKGLVHGIGVAERDGRHDIAECPVKGYHFFDEWIRSGLLGYRMFGMGGML